MGCITPTVPLKSEADCIFASKTSKSATVIVSFADLFRSIVAEVSVLPALLLLLVFGLPTEYVFILKAVFVLLAGLALAKEGSFLDVVVGDGNENGK